MDPFTYSEVGATRPDRGPLPRDYHHLRETTPLGHGRATWQAAAEAVPGWRRLIRKDRRDTP